MTSTKTKDIEEIIKELEKNGKVISGISDAIFKALFQDPKMKGILSYILSEVINMDDMYIYNNLTFVNSELTKGNYFEKGRKTDLLIDIEKSLFNIEATKHTNKGQTALRQAYHHYLAARKDLMGENNYDKKSIQIEFDCVNKYDERLIIPFMLRDDTGKYVLEENFVRYNINMAKLGKVCYNEIDKLTRFEKILHILKTESKKDLDKLSEGDEELRYMTKKIKDMSKDPKIIEWYSKDEQDKIISDINIYEAKKSGKSEGKAEGRSEGIAFEKLEVARNMLQDNLPIDSIIKYTSLTKKQIEDLK